MVGVSAAVTGVSLPPIAAGRTYAGAPESAADLVRGDERGHGYSTELQRSAVPVLVEAVGTSRPSAAKPVPERP